MAPHQRAACRESAWPHLFGTNRCRDRTGLRNDDESSLTCRSLRRPPAQAGAWREHLPNGRVRYFRLDAGGVIALSLARAPSVAKLGSFALIPEDWHQPLRQRMVLLQDAPAQLRAFFKYIATPAAQEVMVRYGFAVPKDR